MTPVCLLHWLVAMKINWFPALASGKWRRIYISINWGRHSGTNSNTRRWCLIFVLVQGQLLSYNYIHVWQDWRPIKRSRQCVILLTLLLVISKHLMLGLTENKIWDALIKVPPFLRDYLWTCILLRVHIHREWSNTWLFLMWLESCGQIGLYLMHHERWELWFTEFFRYLPVWCKWLLWLYAARY